MPGTTSSIDLSWIPLGAGGRVVRRCGRVYEALVAWRERREPLDLYHAALQVTAEDRRFTIEMAPAWVDGSPLRGVRVEGPVGLRALGRLRAFRYEVRCWPDGHIPDLAESVDSPRHLAAKPEQVRRLLDAIGEVPPLIWGRDEIGSGEMWNSNSLVAWLLARAGLDRDAAALRPPTRGRAPGWHAGLALAGMAEVDQALSP